MFDAPKITLKITLVALAALVGALASSACASSNFSASTPTPPPEKPPDLQTGGELRLALLLAPEHLDPHNSVGSGTLNWTAGLVYSRLFRFESGMGDAGAPYILERRVVCDLCESWRRLDARTFEITLRDDVYWQNRAPLNGRKLTAADVVASYQRQAQAPNLNAFLLQNFESFATLDERVFQFTLIQPDAEVFEKLAHAGSSIVPPELYREGASPRLNDVAVGTGAWMLDEGGGLYTLTANKNYYQFDSAGKRLPYLDKVEIQFLDDPAAQSASVLTRFFDAAFVAPETTVAAFRANNPQLNIYTTADYGNGVEVALNAAHPVLSDKTVRQALFLSWDIPDLASRLWGEAAAPTSGLPAPRSEWHNKTLFDGRFGDIRRARELLTDAGFNNGETLTVTVGDFGDNYKFLGEAMVDALNMMMVGVPAELEIITTREFAERVWLNGDFQIAVGAAAPVFSLTDKLLTFHHSDGALNNTGYANRELDALIEAQAGEYDAAERRRLFQMIETLVADGYHRFNAAADIANWVTSPCVQNFAPNTAGASGWFLNQVWRGGASCAE